MPGGGAPAGDSFEFRERESYLQGRFDSQGFIVGEVDVEEGGVALRRFPRCAQIRLV